MQWNLSNDRPIYLQLVEQIKYKIIAGEFKPGDKLPSIREFASQVSVNPNTMQKALSELERENLIYTNRTSGKFISEDDEMIKKIRKEIVQDEVEKFLDNMTKLGFTRKETVEIFKDIANNI